VFDSLYLVSDEDEPSCRVCRQVTNNPILVLDPLRTFLGFPLPMSAHQDCALRLETDAAKGRCHRHQPSLAMGSEGQLSAFVEGDGWDEDDPLLIGLVHLACSIGEGCDLILQHGAFGRLCPWCDDHCHVADSRPMLDAEASMCRIENAPIELLRDPAARPSVRVGTLDAFLDGMTTGAKIASLGWAVDHFRGDH
jgi:hypothetical protein